MSIPAQTFPGVYTQLTDKSFFEVASSRFRCGLVGIASRGPFNTPVQVRTVKRFLEVFDQPVANRHLANAVAQVASSSDGCAVVRVGNRYESVGQGTVSGWSNQLTLPSAIVAQQFVAGDYVKVVSPGLASTVNVKVTGRLSSTLTLASAVPMVNTTSSYNNAATIYKSSSANAASKAEALLRTFTYAASPIGGGVVAIVSGTKNDYSFLSKSTHPLGPIQIASVTPSGTTPTITTSAAHGYVNGDVVHLSGFTNSIINGEFSVTRTADTTFTVTLSASTATITTTGLETCAVLAQGDIVKIVSTDGGANTLDAMVKSVGVVSIGGVAHHKVYLYTSNVSESGYQALPLQDNYGVVTAPDTATDSTGGKLYKVGRVASSSRYTTTASLHLNACTEGTWANSDGIKTGLIVNVAPGTAAGTKKLMVYVNSALTETIDNLEETFSSYSTAINGVSNCIEVLDVGGTFKHPANTLNGWSLDSTTRVNFAAFGVDMAEGFNGENASVDDYIGTLDPTTDQHTGIKSFIDNPDLKLNVLCIPGLVDVALSAIDTGLKLQSIHNELALVAHTINAESIIDVPDNLTARQAIDWHNGQGQFINTRNRLDNYNQSAFWNWFQIYDWFNPSQAVWVPPTIAYLGAAAVVFDRKKPWSGIAGMNNGVVTNALALRYPKLTDSVREMNGGGNCVNPIILDENVIMLWGDRTTQREDSKLTSLHNVILSHYILSGMAAIAKTYLWEPNDNELLTQLNLAFIRFLDSVKSEHGIEDPYNLVLNSQNNTADTRNQREVIVDLDFVPTDLAERIFINGTVRKSGGIINSINGLNV